MSEIECKGTTFNDLTHLCAGKGVGLVLTEDVELSVLEEFTELLKKIDTCKKMHKKICIFQIFVVTLCPKMEK